EVIEKYGADALRFTLATGATPGNDMRISLERIEGSRNFANKLWNAARFVVAKCPERPPEPRPETLDLPARWIRSRTETVVADVSRLLEAYNFGEAGRLLYDFVWSELC